MTLEKTCLLTLVIIMSVNAGEGRERWRRVFAIAEGASARLYTAVILVVVLWFCGSSVCGQLRREDVVERAGLAGWLRN